MRDRARRNRRACSGPWRDARAAVANAHSAVPAQPDRGNDDDGFDSLAGLDAAAVNVVVAVNPVRAPDHAEGVRTVPRLANPKQPRAVVAAAASAAACRLCPDWSDHDQPFR